MILNLDTKIMTKNANSKSKVPGNKPHCEFKSRLIAGDILKVLKKQSISKKFDVIIADPPYNIKKDFGNNKDNLPLEEYINWTKSWLKLCFELLAKNGVIYVYGFPEILAHVAVNYPLNSQRWLVWHYTNKTVPSSKFWQRSHESILCLWRGTQPRPKLEIDQIREPYTPGFMVNAGKIRATTAGRFSQGRKGTETIYKAHKNGALPRDVIKIPALAGGAGSSERWFMCIDCNGQIYPPNNLKEHQGHQILKHPTQKPMQLTERLIRSRIKGNRGRVLIPFAGSGSECVVAQKLNLEWLGIEINPIYASFAKKWLNAIRSISEI